MNYLITNADTAEQLSAAVESLEAFDTWQYRDLRSAEGFSIAMKGAFNGFETFTYATPKGMKVDIVKEEPE